MGVFLPQKRALEADEHERFFFIHLVYTSNVTMKLMSIIARW